GLHRRFGLAVWHWAVRSMTAAWQSRVGSPLLVAVVQPGPPHWQSHIASHWGQPGINPPQPSGTLGPHSVPVHWVFWFGQMVVVVVDVVVVVVVVVSVVLVVVVVVVSVVLVVVVVLVSVEVVVVVALGFFSDGTHSSRRWIRKPPRRPNWLLMKNWTVPNGSPLVR